MAYLCCSCCTGSGAASCFVGEQAALYAVHNDCAQAASCDCLKSKCLREDILENAW